MTLKFVRYAAWAGIVLLAFSVGLASVLWYRGQSQTQTTGIASIGGDFSLVDTNGARVREADFLGKPRAMFFGFTHCPEVCPTTLFEATNWLQALGSDADKLAFLFVTVDPERDTPEVLKEYMSAFNANVVGLTGSRADIDAVVKAYRVFARRVELADGDYTMDHTAAVYLIDAKGAFVGSINYTEDQDAAVAKLKKLLGKG